MKKCFCFAFIMVLLHSLPIHAETDMQEPVQIKISIQHIKQELWKVTYDISQPLLALRFDASTNLFRRKNWKILTKDIGLTTAHGSEIFFAKTGKLFNRVSVEFRSYYKATPKDYEFFRLFTDGSQIMYTGHLNVRPLYLDPGESFEEASHFSTNKKRKFELQFQFIPKTGEHVVLLGKQHKNKSVYWRNPFKEGTYVYFGNITPMDSEFIVAVFDPGMPVWLHKKMRVILPKLLSFYKGATGIPLNFKPTFFFSYKESDEPGFSAGGSTLPGLLQLDVSGQGYKIESKEGFKRLFKITAHEVAHFWNSRMFPHNEHQENSWMHEGGADAFAYRALLQHGFITKEELLNYYNTSLNKCALGLNGNALKEAHRLRDFDNSYACGSTIALLTELALLRAHKGDLFSFWKELFKQAKKQNNTYSKRLYFSVLKGMTGDKKTIRAIEKLVSQPQKDITSFFIKAFKKLDLNVDLEHQKPTEEYLRKIGRQLLGHIMKQDCNGSVSLWHRHDYVKIEGLDVCKTLHQEYSVDRVGNYAVYSQADQAYDYVYKQCKAKRDLVLGLFSSSETIKVPCRKMLPRRPLPLNLGKELHLFQ